jgi:hypothetical protein
MHHINDTKLALNNTKNHNWFLRFNVFFTLGILLLIQNNTRFGKYSRKSVLCTYLYKGRCAELYYLVVALTTRIPSEEKNHLNPTAKKQNIQCLLIHYSFDSPNYINAVNITSSCSLPIVN